MKFKIPCKWALRTVEEIEATTLFDAESKAMLMTKPKSLKGVEHLDIERDLFAVDMERMREMHPIPEPPDPMKGWKKIADSAYDKAWERKFGDAKVRVWAHDDPESGVGIGSMDYRWTIEKKGDDFEMTSKMSFSLPEEAAKDANVVIGRLG